MDLQFTNEIKNSLPCHVLCVFQTVSRVEYILSAQDMVAAESRKIEQDAEMLKEVAMIHNNARLLLEMLANKDKSGEEKVLLDELYKTCLDLRPKLYRLAGKLSDRLF